MLFILFRRVRFPLISLDSFPIYKVNDRVKFVESKRFLLLDHGNKYSIADLNSEISIFSEWTSNDFITKDNEVLSSDSKARAKKTIQLLNDAALRERKNKESLIYKKLKESENAMNRSVKKMGKIKYET